MRLLGFAILVVITATAATARSPVPAGENPNPVLLVRPSAGPLSAMAQLGRRVFFDPRVSSSGRLSCASCHSPQNAYGPSGHNPVMLGGPMLSRQGLRAVPSLMYLERQPTFSIGPDDAENENVNLVQLATRSHNTRSHQKTAQNTAQTATNVVPQGGLFWDGRADTLQSQALGPLLNPRELDGGSILRVASRLREAPYAPLFAQLFGPSILRDARGLVAEALFALARYEFEDRSFHPYASKYDLWLEGKVRFRPAELRGYRAFNAPKRANCAACHLDKPSADRLPPLFTDHQFEALGVPRNMALDANHDRHYFDLGICGPTRTDMRSQTRYCGMFLTPTLRNVATRHTFYHNGIYRSLRQVLDFYNFRATRPREVYPLGPDGKPDQFQDIPPPYHANVDVADPPFDRTRDARPPMSAQDVEDIIAFLETLTDGYKTTQSWRPEELGQSSSVMRR